MDILKGIISKEDLNISKEDLEKRLGNLDILFDASLDKVIPDRISVLVRHRDVVIENVKDITDIEDIEKKIEGIEKREKNYKGKVNLNLLYFFKDFEGKKEKGREKEDKDDKKGKERSRERSKEKSKGNFFKTSFERELESTVDKVNKNSYLMDLFRDKLIEDKILHQFWEYEKEYGRGSEKDTKEDIEEDIDEYIKEDIEERNKYYVAHYYEILSRYKEELGGELKELKKMYDKSDFRIDWNDFKKRLIYLRYVLDIKR